MRQPLGQLRERKTETQTGADRREHVGYVVQADEMGLEENGLASEMERAAGRARAELERRDGDVGARSRVVARPARADGRGGDERGSARHVVRDAEAGIDADEAGSRRPAVARIDETGHPDGRVQLRGSRQLDEGDVGLGAEVERGCLARERVAVADGRNDERDAPSASPFRTPRIPRRASRTPRSSWALQGSNLRRSDYESAALTG